MLFFEMTEVATLKNRKDAMAILLEATGLMAECFYFL